MSTKEVYFLLALSLASVALITAEAEESSGQAGGSTLHDDNNECWAGSSPTTTDFSGGGVADVISRCLFERMLKHRNDENCPGKNFYTYDAFISAANDFHCFGRTGNLDTRKREIAAFLAQTSHETTGGWPAAPDGPYAWGYCFKEEQGNPPDYCVQSIEWPCAAGKKYYGRGPIQLSNNYNYGRAGKALGLDLLNDPDKVATDPVIAFKTALWFWMTPQAPKPSCHAVMTGQWEPSDADKKAGREPGFGLTTNIINGGLECSRGRDDRVESRIGFYKAFCHMLGVSPGDNLDCNRQSHFGLGADLRMLLSEKTSGVCVQVCF